MKGLFKNYNKNITNIIATFLFFVTLSPALAFAETSVTLDIFSQKLNFNLPQKWKKVHKESLSTMFSAEYIPEHQHLNEWEELICVQGFHNVSQDVKPEKFLDSLAQTYQEHCQGEVIFQPMGEVSHSGYSGSHAILGCTRMPNTHTITTGKMQTFVSKPKGEIGYFTVLMAENDTLILLHKSQRGKVFSSKQPPLSIQNYQAFVDSLF
ncbi:hypothetical protein D5018_16870 [Parashewanella curva]|uniref:DUF1795 domain-containing protein n=1 Tax=Parashewanella curva TaxID=2338552 RepID=A0A3L8PT07_9GAMM|nr:hypothetical protein [Parashewanella curva]RLV58525.1 hypothetical protein D5018_16870 [Parashewanella curva]